MAGNSKLFTSSKRVVKMLLPAIAGTLFAAIFQFQGFLVACQIYLKHRNDCLMAFMTRKRSALYRKLKIARQRRLMRRNRGCWFKPGRTEQWWRNMISGATPEETWKKNFRLTREEFMDLTEQLLPYISPNLSSPNYRVLSTDKKLAITL